MEGLVPGDGRSNRAGDVGFFSHAPIMATGGQTIHMPNKDRSFNEAPEKADGEELLYSACALAIIST